MKRDVDSQSSTIVLFACSAQPFMVLEVYMSFKLLIWYWNSSTSQWIAPKNYFTHLLAILTFPLILYFYTSLNYLRSKAIKIRTSPTDWYSMGQVFLHTAEDMIENYFVPAFPTQTHHKKFPNKHVPNLIVHIWCKRSIVSKKGIVSS